MPLPQLFGDLGALATRGMRIPRVNVGARTPSTFPSNAGAGTALPPAPDATGPASNDTDQQTDDPGSSPGSGGIGSNPPLSPRLKQPPLTEGMQQEKDLLDKPPAAATGVRGVLGKVLMNVGPFLAGPMAATVGERVAYPGIDAYRANLERAQAKAGLEDEALKRQEAQQRIAESQENMRAMRDYRQQTSQDRQQNTYDRRMGDITKAGGFEAPVIPPSLTTIPTGSTPNEEPTAGGAAPDAATVNNLPQNNLILSPGLQASQSARLGTVQNLTDPGSGVTTPMVTPNLKTKQEMSRVDAPQDILDFYKNLPHDFTQAYPTGAPLIGPDGKVSPEEAKRLEQKYQRDSAALQAWQTQRGKPEKEVSNPEQVLLNPDKYSPSQVKTARDLFAQQHRDPNAMPGSPNGAPGRNPSLGPGQRDEAMLSKLDPGTQAVIKQIVDYKYQLPTGIALSKPYWQNILQVAAQYDPSFDASLYQNRQALRKDFMSGKSAQAINSLNTVAQHIDKLETNWKALNNTNTLPGITNPIANALGSPLNANLQARLNKFQLDQEAVSNELMRVWRQVGASEAEIQQWSKKLSANLSPQAQQAAIKEIYGLIQGKMAALKNQYETGMGRPADFKMLQPDTAERFKAHGVDPSDLAPNATYGASQRTNQNPNPNGYVVGHVYGGLTYKGGDPNNQASWQK